MKRHKASGWLTRLAFALALGLAAFGTAQTVNYFSFTTGSDKLDVLEHLIDVFEAENAGLVVAEVELSHPDEPVTLPPWVGEEVTFDPRYRNSALVNAPMGEGADI